MGSCAGLSSKQQQKKPTGNHLKNQKIKSDIPKCTTTALIRKPNNQDESFGPSKKTSGVEPNHNDESVEFHQKSSAYEDRSIFVNQDISQRKSPAPDQWVPVSISQEYQARQGNIVLNIKEVDKNPMAIKIPELEINSESSPSVNWDFGSLPKNVDIVL